MSGHLARLLESGVLSVESWERHRYYRLAGPQIAQALEALAICAPTAPVRSLRQSQAAAAVRFARTCYDHMAGPDEALILAQALRDRGELQDARRIAAHGLSLAGPKGALAPWLRDLALEMGDTRQALAAAEVAFKEEPSLPLYMQMRELDAEGWPARRTELLAYLRRTPRTYYPQGPVDIFLHDGLLDDAIAAVEHGATHILVEQVVTAAIPTHPDWAIKTARGQAEPFMNEGKSQYYGAAARWLAHARDAYRAAGREPEWRAYHQHLLTLHGRKYRLVPLLQQLR